MTINSKVDICNMALSHLGNYGTVTNIDTPTNDKEITFALWYDITRQTTLKYLMPNFALARKVVAKLVETPIFGYAYAYEYPNDCLKVLGIGDIDQKGFNYTIEGGKIYTDVDYEEGMPIRYIKDIKDVNKFSPEFKMHFSFDLANNTALPITQDKDKAAFIIAQLPGKMAMLSGVNAQENPPVRRSISRFRTSRYGVIRDNAQKK